MSIAPQGDYLLCEQVKEETGVITQSNNAASWQKFKVVATGDGYYNEQFDRTIPPTVEPGDVIYVQQHADADTPDDLRAKGLYLLQGSRIMAVETSG
jgi:co-chaperonin GroES (HSP10)